MLTVLDIENALEGLPKTMEVLIVNCSGTGFDHIESITEEVVCHYIDHKEENGIGEKSVMVIR